MLLVPNQPRRLSGKKIIVVNKLLKAMIRMAEFIKSTSGKIPKAEDIKLINGLIKMKMFISVTDLKMKMDAFMKLSKLHHQQE